MGQAIKTPVSFDTASALRYWLKKKNMTQGDIMRRTGLERAYVSRLATNQVQYPRLQTLQKLADALGITLAEFLAAAVGTRGRRETSSSEETERARA